MAQERAAKRSRKEEPSSSLTDPSGTASVQQGSNPFARLPDALVQQILSNIDALGAYKHSKLWAVDRRFRQLLPGVLWKSIEFDASAVKAEDTESQSNGFQKQLKRFAELLGSRQMLGVKHLDISCVLPPNYEEELEYSNRNEKEIMEHAQCISNCIAGLLAAAATAAAPPESIDFRATWDWWIPTDRQRELGLKPISLEQAATTFMVAVSPAPLKSMKVSSCEFFLTALASVVKPAHAQSLLKFNVGNVDTVALSKDHVARLVAEFPALRSLNARVEGGEALQEIAGCAHLEELIVSIKSVDEHVADALAAIAAGPSAAKLRKLVLSGIKSFCGDPKNRARLDAQSLASVLRLSSLEEVSISVRPDCAALLPALGRLERLRVVDLTLNLLGAAAGGAGLLRAGAELLRSRAGQGLKKCNMNVC
eukprot:tig00000042_g15520.t1